jgi:hypothetical protein
MEICSGDRQISWKSIPLTMDTTVADAFEKGDCFYISHKTALLLGQTEEVINVAVSICEKELGGTTNRLNRLYLVLKPYKSLLIVCNYYLSNFFQ